MVLADIPKRIKGTRYWAKHGKERVYFNIKTYKDRYCNAKVWLEVVNDRLEFQVRVLHERKHYREFEHIAEGIRREMTEMYHEVITETELERRKAPVDIRLSDDVPMYSSAENMPHQDNALRFFCSRKVGALFADVGTGKTKIAIDLAESRYKAGRITKVLVFCPVSTIANFKEEVHKFSSISSLEWHYVGLESISLSHDAYLYASRIVSPDTMIIIDESHLVKTPSANRSKWVYDVCQKSSYKLIMTGTPIADNAHDLYMQYSMLSNDILQCKSWGEYEKKYVLYGGATGMDIVGYKNLDYLAGLIEPYTYQIKKEDCLRLPSKRFYTYTCGLTDKQHEMYSKAKEDLLKKIESGDYTGDTIFLYLTRMQQISCGYCYDELGEFVYIGTKKMELIEKIGIPDRAIFFCKYLFEVDMVVNHLGAHRCSVFTGQNRKDRDREKDRFVNGDTDFFVATSSSGGTGLNGLQVCNTMFRLSSSYKYIDEKQTVGRIDRAGQKQDMTIYDICTSAGIDDMIRNNILRKTSLDKEITQIIADKTALKEFVSKL